MRNKAMLKQAGEALWIIPGFSKYAVGHDGRVWRIARSASLRHRYLPPPYVVRPKKTTKGYLNVSLLADDGGRRTLRVNRLIALAYHGPAPFKDAQAAHDDGNPANNSPDNVVWKRPIENNRDRHKHGTVPRGETHWNAKLTAGDIPKIKRMLAAGRSQRFVAARFGVSQTTVGRIGRGKLWK